MCVCVNARSALAASDWQARKRWEKAPGRSLALTFAVNRRGFCASSVRVTPRIASHRLVSFRYHYLYSDLDVVAASAICVDY